MAKLMFSRAVKRGRLFAKCGCCGVTGVRLYRPYGNFYRPEDNRCNAHVTTEQRGWYVPLCLSDMGAPWGFTSVSKSDCERFYAKSEASPSHPTWTRRGWSDNEYL